VVNQVACMTWQLPKVTPQAYVAQNPDRDIRITPKNEHGDPTFGAGVVLTGVRFSGDSIFGRDPKGQPLAFSLQQLSALEVRRVDGVRTGLWVLGTAIFLAGAAFFVAYAGGCAMYPSGSVGGVSC